MWCTHSFAVHRAFLWLLSTIYRSRMSALCKQALPFQRYLRALHREHAAQDVSIGLILISVVTYFCFAFSGFIVQPVPFYFVWLHKARPWQQTLGFFGNSSCLAAAQRAGCCCV